MEKNTETEEKISQVVNRKLLDLVELEPIEQEERIEEICEEYQMKKGSLMKQLKFIHKREKEKQKMNTQFDKNITSFFNMRNLAEQFIDLHPCWYDEGKNWWIWDYKDYKWKRTDETDILNAIESQAMIDTIASKNKMEIIEALKQVSRQNPPEEIKPTWIQFKKEIFDIQTGERFKAQPTWFVCNPIPHELNENCFEETPNMDRIFEEWVGKDHVKTLYEILAYCIIPDYPIQRLFCLMGSGSNGKSCFLRLIEKFVGNENICSTELDTLMSSRFEMVKLFKKLVCQMGETDFGEISRTSLLKKLTGKDLLGFEYKGGRNFDGYNYAKILIATNNLPTTTDKTDGFYRRWNIVDFPNQFSEAKDILAEIPDEEFSALALKCCSILKDLLGQRKFSNDGSIEERRMKYEEKSNFLDLFIKTFTEVEENTEIGYIRVNEFYKRFKDWSKENRHREMSETSVSLKMKEMGYIHERKYFKWMYNGNGGTARSWIGIKWKGEIPTNEPEDLMVSVEKI